MIQSKFKKIVLSILLIIVMVLMVGQNMIYAVKTGPITISALEERWVKEGETFVRKKKYKIGNDDILYQIASMNGTTITATNFYCLDGTKTPGNTYQTGYDMITEKSSIAALSGTGYEAYRNTVDDRIYTQLMWIFDHMYINGSDTIDGFLQRAGFVKRTHPDFEKECWFTVDNNWFYGKDSQGYIYLDPNNSSNAITVMLTQEEIEAAQQAAIWYFTNYVIGNDTTYQGIYVTPSNSSLDSTWFEFTEDTYPGNTSAEITTNQYIKSYRQEQAAVIANYLISGAIKAANDGYDVTNSTAALDFTYVEGEKIVKEGSNYVIGPVKITTTGNVEDLSIVVKTGDGYNQTINSSSVTLRNSSGTTISSLPVNQNFYVVVPQSSVVDSVKIFIDANKTTTTKTLWVAETGGSTQPVVEYERNKEDIEKSLTATPDTRVFDLALRKQIVKVNGTSTLLNEAGIDASRTINIDTSTIPDTATYNHRKDPIVVSTGDTVTYRLYIYNEGQIDGYASRIVDTLASGLKKADSMGTTVTSNKGTTYTVSTSGSTITLTQTGTAQKISAFASTLDSDYVEITCEVTQNPATDGNTKHYLSNIAYIDQAKDEDNNVVARDRDNTESTPGNTNTTNGGKGLNVTNRNDVYHGSTNKNIFNNTNNNTDYFAGQEDDDDFETVVVLPKEFDLKLMKFIAEVNGTPSNRTLTVDASKLNTIVGGKKVTTADYQVTKVPITVETGDIIKYTLRIYNEGEVDGYAEEITEDIPAGLQFITIPSTPEETAAMQFNESMGWEVASSSSGIIQTVKTSYLSRTKDAAGNLIKAYNGTTLDYKEVSIMLKVVAVNVRNIIRNEAEISKDKDKDGNEVIDRDSTPEEWKKEDSDDYYEDNPEYPKYKEDDEDYDNIKLVRFDLALRKFISSVSSNGDFEDVNTTTAYARAPQVDVSKLNTVDATGNVVTTATYNHPKEPVVLDIGSYVLYTIRVYNEGDIDGYAKEITDYLPTYLDFVDGTAYSEINSKWTYDPTTRKVTTNALATRKLVAFDGTELDYADVQIICKVNDTAISTKKITNIAEISQYADEDGDRDTDVDSTRDNLVYPDDESTYKDTEINRGDSYIPGQEDDDDFEKVVIRGPGKYDLVLIKEDENGEDLNSKATFEVNGVTKEVTGRLIIADDVVIDGTNVNTPDIYTIKETIPPDDYCTFDGIITITVTKKTSGNGYAIDKAEYVVKDKDGNIMDTTDANVYLRDGNIYVEVVDHEEPKPGKYDLVLIKEDENGEDLNSKATFEVNGETKEVTGRLIIADDVEINEGNVNTPDIYTIKETIPPDDYCTFDGIITITVTKKLSDNKYVLDKAEYVVKDKDGKVMDTTDANVYVKDGNIYVEVVDHEEKVFDLALRKFITNISGEDVTTRIPDVGYENGKITYTHPKDVVKVHVEDIVTYTLRVFNEGELDGYAEKISDDIPEYLEFLPDHEINKEYRWVMLDKDGKETTDVKEAVRIMTDYTSRENGAEKNLLKAFDPTKPISDTNPAHLDVKVAFKVKDPNSSKYVIVNKAQISEDADENGDSIDDIDSIPDEWNEGEDDQDYENVSVEYFDLALLKYVTKVHVTENGKTTTRSTGNTGADTDIIPKVEIHKNRVKTTVVKFEYTIKITNEGEIAGYAKEITDYVPKGLKFYAADNTGWKDEGNNVISTKLLENTLLQPGQSATVKVILRWINGENNLQTKINIAEISEDYNDKDVPDRDSTPDNQKPGEDDIDDAPVVLGIKTGLTENILMYVGVSLVILTIMGAGIVLIKKYVL